jgi:N-acetylmuramoyl-L-alanine amidase
MSKYVWLLDAGHGGIIDGVYQTNGKRSPIWPDGRQLFEGEFNRDIVNRISGMLNNASIHNFILVKDNTDVSLADRVIRANNINMGNNGFTVYLSIHANAGGGSGYEVFTTKGQTKADAFATVFYKELGKEFPTMKGRPDVSDGDPDKEESFYVLKYSNMPAILTENFFMDTLNPDCELIMSEEGRQRIAKAHYNAIMYIESNRL